MPPCEGYCPESSGQVSAVSCCPPRAAFDPTECSGSSLFLSPSLAPESGSLSFSRRCGERWRGSGQGLKGLPYMPLGLLTQVSRPRERYCDRSDWGAALASWSCPVMPRGEICSCFVESRLEEGPGPQCPCHLERAVVWGVHSAM